MNLEFRAQPGVRLRTLAEQATDEAKILNATDWLNRQILRVGNDKAIADFMAGRYHEYREYHENRLKEEARAKEEDGLRDYLSRYMNQPEPQPSLEVFVTETMAKDIKRAIFDDVATLSNAAWFTAPSPLGGLAGWLAGEGQTITDTVEASRFAVGDVVKFKSGGFPMTVEDVGFCACGAEVIDLIWQDADGRFCEVDGIDADLVDLA
jgi:hypothetical protein